MSHDVWSTVDDYVSSLYPGDPVYREILERSKAAELPDISVSAEHGRFLSVLVRGIGARTVLEIGTLGGLSAVYLANAIPEDGHVVTLEADPNHVRVARRNLTIAGVADRVRVVEGPALESLRGLTDEYAEGFDFIFIDADKEGYPGYWKWALRLAHPGTLIVADNVVREGAVADQENREPRVVGVREYLRLATGEPTVCTSVIQTVGTKGHDGFAVSVVVRDGS